MGDEGVTRSCEFASWQSKHRQDLEECRGAREQEVFPTAVPSETKEAGQFYSTDLYVVIWGEPIPGHAQCSSFLSVTK